MWQFYTDRGKRVIELAQQEALELGHTMVDPEHLLLGVLQEGGGVACQALTELGVDTENFAAHIRDLIGRSQDVISKPVDLPLSPRMRRALDLAMAEARKMGVNYVDTEHILLGILADDSGLIVQQFKSMGVTPMSVLKQINEILSGTAGRKIAGNNKNSGVKQKNKIKTPTLDHLGIDLTARAKNNELDPVIGREKEIKRVMQVLCRRTKCNPVLIGDPGVGKTAVVEGLARSLTL